MSSIVVNIVVNMLMVALLILTIAYCWVLNRRIKILQDSKSELAQLLRYFDESTQRASESIVALQSSSKKIGDSIQSKIDKANYMLDDLAFMIEKGNKIASQIEAGMAVQRARTRMTTPSSTPSAHSSEPPMTAIVHEEAAARPAPPEPKPQMSYKEQTNAPLEAVLERINERHRSPPVLESDAMQQKLVAAKEAIRSQSEKELLALLKSSMKV